MDNLDVIICKNSAESIVESIQKALKTGINEKPIKDICLVDSTKEEIVIIISTDIIGKDIAKAFWLGYQSAIR
jgi:hypothetical protein